MGLEITDPIPAKLKKCYALSDSVRTLSLPKAGELDGYVRSLEMARNIGDVSAIRRAATDLVHQLAKFYKIPPPKVVLRDSRPRVTTAGAVHELHGIYDHRREAITIWVRTAVRHQIVAFRRLLLTLIHEFCHHLDLPYLEIPISFHTIGFYERERRLFYRLIRQRPAKGQWWPTLDGRWVWQWAEPGRPRKKASGQMRRS